MWKNFKRYIPKGYENDIVLYLKSSDGKDWYSLQHLFKENTTKIMVDDSNRIIAASKDASLLFPENCSVYEVENIEPDEVYNSEAYYVENKVVFLNDTVNRAILVKNNIITMDTEHTKARIERSILFKQLDVLDSKVAIGRIKLSEDEKKEIEEWYLCWLNITDTYRDANVPIENFYPKIPKLIEYFK